MSAERPRVLLVGGEDAERAAEVLAAAGVPAEGVRVPDEAGARAELASGGVDLVVAARPGGGGDAVAMATRLRGDLGGRPLVVVSAGPGEEDAAAAMRAGAADVVPAEDLARLPEVARRELGRPGRTAGAAPGAGPMAEAMRGVLRAGGTLAVMAAGADGRISAVNEGAEALVGLPRADLVGRPLSDLHDPGELELLAIRRGAASGLDALLAEARAGRAEAREWTLVRAGGGGVPVCAAVVPVLDDAGTGAGVIEIARDISRSRRRDREERALRSVATTVAAGDDEDAILARIAEEAAALLGADAAGIARMEEPARVEPEAGRAPDAPRREAVDRAAAELVRSAPGAVRVDDLGLPAIAARPSDPLPRGLLAAPVRVGDRLWGALWTAASAPGAFSDDDARALERIADLVAVAAANAEERERIVSETVAAIFQGDRDIGEVLGLIASSARRALRASRATCYVMREGAEQVVAVHTTETDPRRRAALEAAAERARERLPVWDVLLASPDPVLVVPDVRADARVSRSLADALGAGAFVGVRLEHPSVRTGGAMELLGALFISFPTPRRVTPLERTTARSMATMAAVALANSRLHAAMQRHVARMERLVSADALTGLANHRSFQDRLDQEFTRARRHGRGLSVALIDVDWLREINERHGHEAGDDVLVELAGRLTRLVRGSDLLARVGGEEFAWLMPETAGMEAWQAAERAREAIGLAPFPHVGRVTVSAGVAGLEHAGSPHELVRLAEGALYWAKQHGRDSAFVYSPDVVEAMSADERAERLQRLQSLQSIRVLARAVDAKDPSTSEHSERVADLAAAIAAGLGWPEERSERLREAGLVHDVGKIGVPDAILFKPDRLTPREYREVTRHATIGAEMVADVLEEEQVAWVRGHHERWDGGGYPDGLAGEAIPEGARILAIADAWDVMTSVRPYGEPLGVAEAVAECRDCAGSHFWERAVDAIERLVGAGVVGGER